MLTAKRRLRGVRLLEPSPAYAHLSAATAAEVMQPIFQDELSGAWNRPVRLGKFFIPRVIPIGGGKFLIQYRFSTVEATGPRDWIFFGRILAPDETVPTFVQKPNAFYLAQFRLVVPIFPFDPKLKVLKKFFQPEEAPALLNSLQPVLNGRITIEKLDVLGYRLELRSRSLLRLDLKQDSRTTTLVAKVMRPERAAQLFWHLQELERSGFHTRAADAITIPHPIAYAPEGIIWLEAVFDPSLHDVIGEEAFVSGCGAAARTLNKLKTAPLENLVPYTLEEELLLLRQTGAEIAQIYPVLAERLQEVLALVLQNAPAARQNRPAPVHRDFYDKQLLIGAARTTLIDADTLALSDPALDVGNFLAHLTLRAKQNPAFHVFVKNGRRAFTAEYRVKDLSLPAEEFWRSVRWWEAAALLRLGCLYSLRPRWKNLAIPLLEQARKMLTHAGGIDG